MRSVRTTAHADVVFLVEHIAEKNIVPVCVDGAQLVYPLFGVVRQPIPTEVLVCLVFSQLVQDVGHASLVLAIVVRTVEQIQFKVYLFIGVQQVQTVYVGAWVVSQLGREVDDGSAFLASFGGDYNHAVCGSCTVDGGGRRVFQYGNVLNVRWVQTSDAGLVNVINVIQIVNVGNLITLQRYSVKHPKRFLHTIDGRGSADSDLHWGARRTA